MLLVPIHVTAGLLGLSSGAVALAARKGGTLHRRGGLVFVASMLTMSATGTWMAARMKGPVTDISVMVGVLTFYLVATGFLTFRRPVAEIRRLQLALALVATGVAACAFAYGIAALRSATGEADGVPAGMYFVFGSIALAGAMLDVRLLRAGAIQGAHRLARHLWRMGMAMWIATTSFFYGQQKVFPHSVRESGVLSLPILLVALVVLYWLVRVAWKRQDALRGMRRPVVSQSPGQA
ncbi:MAG: hypothetical protein ACTHOC_05800 [Luteimonas sp.]